MPAAAPDDAVVTKLAAAGLSLTSGANLFTGPVRPHHASNPPLASVFCLATGGPENRPYLGNAEDWREKTVQVRIRSAPRSFTVGRTLARNVLVALHRAAITGWTHCLVREAEPTYLGQDVNDCHEWSLNVVLGIRE